MLKRSELSSYKHIEFKCILQCERSQSVRWHPGRDKTTEHNMISDSQEWAGWEEQGAWIGRAERILFLFFHAIFSWVQRERLFIPGRALCSSGYMQFLLHLSKLKGCATPGVGLNISSAPQGTMMSSFVVMGMPLWWRILLTREGVHGCQQAVDGLSPYHPLHCVENL